MKPNKYENDTPVVILLIVLISATVFMSSYSPNINVYARAHIDSFGRIVYTASLGKGVNYLSFAHAYSSNYTNNDTLRRDFSRFQQDGINVISLSLYWYRLEGHVRGSYDGTYPDCSPYGKRFLDDVKRVIRIANEYRLRVLVAFNTLWGDDSIWCTPDYVVDPVTGKNIGLAIVRSDDMKEAFINAFNHTVGYLAGTPGIWAWAILNEPWYWPHTLDPPHEKIDQRENFIDLMQKLSDIAKTTDGRPVTVKFSNTHRWIGGDGTPKIKNIFVDDWNWDQRIFDALDFISFNAYIEHQELYHAWKNMTTDNVSGVYDRNGRVWISEFGFSSDDDAIQADSFRRSLEFFGSLKVDGWVQWFWESDDDTVVGKGMNICSDVNNGEARAAYYELAASSTA